MIKSLRIKILIFIATISTAIFVPTILVINNHEKETAITEAKRLNLLTARMLSEKVQGYMHPLLEQGQILRQYALDTWRNGDLNMSALHRISKSLIEDHSNIMAAWTIYEPKAFKDDETGKHISLLYCKDYDKAVRQNNPNGHKHTTYTVPMQSLQTTIAPPSIASYNEGNHTYCENNGVQVLHSTISMPVLENVLLLGAVGIDVQLNGISDLLSNTGTNESAIALVLTDKGRIVGNAARRDLNRPLDRIYEQADSTIMKMVCAGTMYNDFYLSQRTDERYLLTIYPFAPLGGQTIWTLCLMTPEADVMAETLHQTNTNLLTVIAGLFAIALLSWLLGFYITQPIKHIHHAFSKLAEGKIDINAKLDVHTGDELEQIAGSANALIDNLDRMMAFAIEIGKGNLNVPFKKISHNDVFGEALLKMRASLETSHEHDQIRKIEEQKERWSNDGIAQFAELLRRNYTNMEEFAHTLITHLVNYTEMNVGGLFLLNNTDSNKISFDLTGCYAYDGLKYEQKQIMLGEGLVGRCAKEAETILLTDLPKGYVKIATGLGYDDPTCLLLVPMKHNDEVLGVIEMASFSVVEPHRISFVEKIGSNMAATISNIKINVHTNQLLEESRVKSEELASQEEEMRQNMEELQATQEEAARKHFEMESLIGALNASSIVMEYDLDGHVLSVNKAYLDITHLAESDVLGSHHADNIIFDERQKANYQQFWDDLSRGIVKRTVNKLMVNNTERTFIESYSPIMGDDGLVRRIFKLAHCIDDFNLQQQG